MVQIQKIKKLANIAAESESVPGDIEKFVLTRLGKEDLKAFLRFYKAAIEKKRVYVSSAQELDKDGIKLIQSKFPKKEIVATIDKSLGAGIIVRQDDMIVDFSFKKYIDETIESLKN